MPELTFAGTGLNGQVLRCWLGELAARESESEMFGQNGVSQINGGLGSQIVNVRLRINGFATNAALETYRAITIGSLIGRHGTLVIATGSAAWNKSYSDVVFKGMEDDDTTGPMPTESGLWYQELSLKFKKLSPP
jgi:hypothetical protein